VATHHNRPGGRLLEVALALGLAVLSGAFLAGVVFAGLYLFGPVGDGDGTGGRSLLLGSICLAAYVLKYPWTALLNYYRYDVRTLRPLKKNETATPADGRDENEG
jgi:hypothetical protein